MSDPEHQDQQLPIADLVDDAVVAHPHAVPRLAGQLPAASWARLQLEQHQSTPTCVSSSQAEKAPNG